MLHLPECPREAGPRDVWSRLLPSVSRVESRVTTTRTPDPHLLARCITTWLESGAHARGDNRRPSRLVGSCPVDRQLLHQDELIEAALPFKALLSRLRIRCDYEDFGCCQVVAVASLADHLRVCNFNPDQMIECRNGCAKLFPRKLLVKNRHNCIQELQSLIREQEQAIRDLQSDRTAFQRSCKNQNCVIVVLVAVLVGLLMTALVPDTHARL